MPTPIKNEELQAAIRARLSALEEELAALSVEAQEARLRQAEHEGLSLMLRGGELRVFVRLWQKEPAADRLQLEYA